jgi:predicted RNase H-like nuclease (RuvC/YqgF family)
MKKGVILTLSIVGAIATILISVLIGVLIGNADLEENYTEDLKKIKAEITTAEKEAKNEGEKLLSIQNEISAVEEQLETETQKLEEAEVKAEEVKKLIDEKDTISDDIEKLKKERENAKKEMGELEDDVKAKKDEVSKLDDTIKAKKKEIDQLEETIVKKNEEPIKLTAGQYIVGSDIPEGRYQVTNIGEGTNFFVYDSSGLPTVNTILGDSIVGTGDFVFFTSDGDMIETLGPVKLIPVE